MIPRAACAFAMLALAASAPLPGRAAPRLAPPFLRGINLAGNDRYLGATTWPTDAGTRYWLNRGFNLFRVMTLWENLQPPRDGAPTASLDPVNMAGLRRTIDFLTRRGAWVIIDPHNYLRYKTSGRDADPGSVIGQSTVTDDQFAAFWRSLADAFKNNPRVIFEISTNEPHDADVARMATTFRAAIAAIRATGARNMLLVDGYNFSGAYEWDSAGNDAAMLSLDDPADNLVFAPHLYVDGAGGQKPDCHPGEGPARLNTVTQWARRHGKRLLLDEWGVGDNARCHAAIREIRDFIENSRDVFIGQAAFAAYAGQQPYHLPDTFWLAMDARAGGVEDERVRQLTLPLAPARREVPVAAATLSAIGGNATSPTAPDSRVPARRLTESAELQEHALHTPIIDGRPGDKYLFRVRLRRDAGRRDIGLVISDMTDFKSFALLGIDLDSGRIAFAQASSGGCLTLPTGHARRLDADDWEVEIGSILLKDCPPRRLIGGIVPRLKEQAKVAAYPGDGRASLRVWQASWTISDLE